MQSAHQTGTAAVGWIEAAVLVNVREILPLNERTLQELPQLEELF
jgi:hypothetical protein